VQSRPCCAWIHLDVVNFELPANFEELRTDAGTIAKREPVCSQSSLAKSVTEHASASVCISQHAFRPITAYCCRLACAGLPTGAHVRARVWQLLLGYLPRHSAEWEVTLSTRRSEYASFCEDFMLTANRVVCSCAGLTCGHCLSWTPSKS
jgi:hypothetical protein